MDGWTNPFEKYSSNWIIFPGRDENKKQLKPPPRFLRRIHNISTESLFGQNYYNFQTWTGILLNIVGKKKTYSPKWWFFMVIYHGTIRKKVTWYPSILLFVWMFRVPGWTQHYFKERVFWPGRKRRVIKGYRIPPHDLKETVELNHPKPQTFPPGIWATSKPQDVFLVGGWTNPFEQY